MVLRLTRKCLLNVTCNDISVIYLTAHRCAGGLKKLVRPTVGLPTPNTFRRFFNVPVQASTRGHPFYGYSEKPPHFSRLLRCARRYGWPFLVLNSKGVTLDDISVIYVTAYMNKMFGQPPGSHSIDIQSRPWTWMSEQRRVFLLWLLRETGLALWHNRIQLTV